MTFVTNINSVRTPSSRAQCDDAMSASDSCRSVSEAAPFEESVVLTRAVHILWSSLCSYWRESLLHLSRAKGEDEVGTN